MAFVWSVSGVYKGSQNKHHYLTIIINNKSLLCFLQENAFQLMHVLNGVVYFFVFSNYVSIFKYVS